MADPRIGRTRAALSRALLALVEEKSFAELSVGDIVTRAGIGYATFFRHYPGKDALLLDVADALTDELLALMLPALLQEDHDEQDGNRAGSGTKGSTARRRGRGRQAISNGR